MEDAVDGIVGAGLPSSGWGRESSTAPGVGGTLCLESKLGGFEDSTPAVCRLGRFERRFRPEV